MQSHSRNEGPETDRRIGDDAEWQPLKGALEQFRSAAISSAERPEAFWQRQRQQVLSRQTESRKAPAIRTRMWLWASAVALVLLAVGFFLEEAPDSEPDLPAGHDQQLLVGVERALDFDVPVSLEPAALLLEEMLPRGRIVAEP